MTLVLDLVEECERVSLPVVSAWPTHFNVPRPIFLPVLCGHFKHRRWVQLEGVRCEADADHRGHPPGSKRSSSLESSGECLPAHKAEGVCGRHNC